MKKNTKKYICAAICLFLIAVSVFTAGAENMSWYCVRQKNHMQPRADAGMRFIEDYGGYYIDKNHGDSCSERVIYLTFDAGYENGNVSRVLDELDSRGVKGAFFVLGNIISEAPDLIKRMIEGGHTVCNHTNKHKDMTKMTSKEEFGAELAALETLYREKIGAEMPKYYRPPEGRFNEQTMKYANELGYKTIFWSFAYADWDNNKQPSREYAKEKILSNIHNGAVILLHPTSATNAAIIGEVIDILLRENYRFGTLDELTGDNRT